jgi:hypothetical protein
LQQEYQQEIKKMHKSGEMRLLDMQKNGFKDTESVNLFTYIDRDAFVPQTVAT